MPEVFLASRNRKKLEELRRILTPALPGIEVLGLDDVVAYDEPVEDQPTFEGNALLKARAGVAATGLPSLADDRGLCVDALNAMPGVLSARWSGLPKDDQRNNRLLLDQLADVPDERRDEVVLAGEVIADQPGARQPGPLGDPCERRLAEALLGDHRNGRVEDLCTPGRRGGGALSYLHE